MIWLPRLLKATLVASIAAAVPLAWIRRGRPGIAGVCLLALITAVWLPRLGARAGLRVSAPLEVLWLLPFTACWGLGEGLSLFARISWWDDLTHALGGAAVFGVFVALAQGPLRLSRRAAVVLGLAVALACGALWELGEFASDQLLHTHTQSGNLDTMLDLAFDFAGALAAAAALAVALRARGMARPRPVAALHSRAP